tara:strand:- start:12905 stop:13087 length:183 start_codon:yes stop_codon:yes gene_type:complete
MPFKIEKKKDKWKLYNIHKKVYVNKTFNSKETAISAGKAYMRYRGEKPYLSGNKLLHRKK